MAIVGGKKVVDALDEFLQSSSGNRSSLNDVIAQYRTDNSIGAETMPNVATFDKYLYRGAETTGTTPYVATVWERAGEEIEPQSHQVPHTLLVFMLLVNGDIDGDEATIAERALDYAACVRSMFLRNTTVGTYGGDLNNGGDGATGRILSARIEAAEMLSDDGLNEANVVLLWRVRVVAIEDWPGA